MGCADTCSRRPTPRSVAYEALETKTTQTNHSSWAMYYLRCIASSVDAMFINISSIDSNIHPVTHKPPPPHSVDYVYVHLLQLTVLPTTGIVDLSDLLALEDLGMHACMWTQRRKLPSTETKTQKYIGT